MAETTDEKRADFHPTAEPIAFNVGGAKFATSVDTLRRVPNTYFSNLVSGRWEANLTKDGTIFIDRSPAAFGYLLEYLRSPENFHNIFDLMTPMERYHFEQDCDYYAMPKTLGEQIMLRPLPPITVPPELGMSQQAFDNLQALVEFKSLRLLIRGSTEGFGTYDFHYRCDNQGETMVVAELCEGGFVGGFASRSWHDQWATVEDPSAFLFTIKPGETTVNAHWQVKDVDRALFWHEERGPCFGAPDFHISMERPLRFESHGSVIYEPTGIGGGAALKEVLVYAVERQVSTSLKPVMVPEVLKMKQKAFGHLQELAGFKGVRLIYQWSVDGEGVEKFHEKCDKRGANIVVAELEEGGFIGAYTSVYWTAPSQFTWRDDLSAFLFRIKSADSEKVETYKQIYRPQNAVYHSENCGPSFGAGDFDLSLKDPLIFGGGNSYTYADHGVTKGTPLKDVFVFAVRK